MVASGQSDPFRRIHEIFHEGVLEECSLFLERLQKCLSGVFVRVSISWSHVRTFLPPVMNLLESNDQCNQIAVAIPMVPKFMSYKRYGTGSWWIFRPGF